MTRPPPTPPPTLGSIPRSDRSSPRSTRTAAPSGSCPSRSRSKFSPGCRRRRSSTCPASPRPSDHQPGRAHGEALHHEARAGERESGRAALHSRRRLDRRQFPEPSAPAARSRRRLGADRRVRRIHSLAGSEISDPARGMLCGIEVGRRARRRAWCGRHPYRRCRQFGRRQHDRRARR